MNANETHPACCGCSDCDDALVKPTVKIGRITYAVTVDTDSKGRAKYNLHGPRGAHLWTMRNYHNQDLMFLINARTSKTERIWFTDKSGKLERVEVL